MPEPTNKGPGPDRDGRYGYDPKTLEPSEYPLRDSDLRAIEQKRRNREDAARLAEHLGLDEHYRIPKELRLEGVGKRRRDAVIASYEDFPAMTPEDKALYEGLVRRYGVPLMGLSTEAASFIVRRVVFAYYQLNALRRAEAKGLFTPDELRALLVYLHVEVSDLARMVAPARAGPTNGMIHRWLRGLAKPMGPQASAVDRLIERHVRSRYFDHGRYRDHETHLDAQRKWKANDRARDWKRMPDLPIAHGSEAAAEEVYGPRKRAVPYSPRDPKDPKTDQKD